MSDTTRRPEQEPAIDELPATTDDATTVPDGEAGDVKGGISFGFPDVTKTPSPGGPIPIPYPNFGR